MSIVNATNSNLRQTCITIEEENYRLKQLLQEKKELQQTLEKRIHLLKEKNKSNEKQTQGISFIKTIANAFSSLSEEETKKTTQNEKPKQDITTNKSAGTRYSWQTPEFNRIVEEDRNRERRAALKRKDILNNRN